MKFKAGDKVRRTYPDGATGHLTIGPVYVVKSFHSSGIESTITLESCDIGTSCSCTKDETGHWIARRFELVEIEPDITDEEKRMAKPMATVEELLSFLKDRL